MGTLLVGPIRNHLELLLFFSPRRSDIFHTFFAASNPPRFDLSYSPDRVSPLPAWTAEAPIRHYMQQNGFQRRPDEPVRDIDELQGQIREGVDGVAERP